MLLIVDDLTNKKYVNCVDDIVSLQVLRTEVRFVRINGQVYLRVPQEINYYALETDNQITYILNNSNQEKAYVRVYFQQDGFNRFAKVYTDQKTVIIGTRVDDDFYINESFEDAVRIQINRNNHSIQNESNTDSIYLNHEKIGRSVQYHSGDILQVGCFRLVLHECFLMYNTTTFFSADVPEKGNVCSNRTLNSIVKVDGNICIHKKIIFPEFIINPVSAPMISMKERKPFFLKAGRSLTMSFGSLTIASCMAYQNWLDGRSLLQLAPMFLYPFIMISTTIIWTFVDSMYQKKQEEKQFKEYVKRQKESYGEQEERFLKAYASAVSEARFMFKRKQEIFEILQNERTLEFFDIYDDDFFTLPIGTISYTPSFQVNGNHDELGFTRREIMERLRNHLQEKPLLAHLSSGECLWIEDTKETWFLMGLLLKILVTHSPKNLRIIIVKDDMEDMCFSKIPHSYDKRFGKMFFSRADFLSGMADNLQFMEERFILISFEGSLRVDVGNGIQICVNHDFEHRYDYKIAIQNQYQGILINRREKMTYDFRYEGVSSYEFEHCISRLAIDFHAYESNDSYSFLDVHDWKITNSFDIEKNWKYNHKKHHLIASIGKDKEGRTIYLDFHEKGNGPHGLIGGMTGSGKSEFLISTLLSLCIKYSPQDLQIAMIDFKGGGCAKEFMEDGCYIPHIVGVLDNLDQSILERSLIAFQNECKKRERYMRILSDSCNMNINSIDQYQAYWREDCSIPYLAHLIIVIDEFAEVKKENPEFMTNIISIARVGRSLGIHLLLSTQKPAGIINDQIWSNCRFKICLKVQDSQDSNEMLHSPVATSLKNPGEFYFLCDESLEYGMSGYVNQTLESQSSIFQIRNQKEPDLEQKKNGTVERVHLIHEMNQIYHPFYVEPLWKKPLHRIVWTDVDHPFVFGVADDYFQNRYTEIRLSENTIVFSDKSNKLNQFFLTVIYCLLRSKEKNDEVFIITRTTEQYQRMLDRNLLNGVVDYEDNSLISYLHSHVSEKQCEKWIMIQDLSDLNEEVHQNIYQWLKHSEKFRLHLVVGCSDSSDIRYKEMLKFQNRIVLSANNLSDASALLDGKIHHTFQNGQACIKLDGHILDVYYPETNLEDILSMKANETSFQLPAMPDECSFDIDKDDWFEIGISYRTYQHIMLYKNDVTIMVAEQKRNLDFLRILLQNHQIPMSETIADMDKQIGVVILTTLQEYQKYQTKLSGYTLLYIGRGYQSQYVLKRMFKEELHWNEGVLYRDDDWEKLRIISMEKYEER